MVPWSRNRGLFLEFRAALLAGICSPVRPRSTVGPLGGTRNTFHVIQANHSAPQTSKNGERMSQAAHLSSIVREIKQVWSD